MADQRAGASRGMHCESASTNQRWDQWSFVLTFFSFLLFQTLPACFHHARNFSLERVAAETDAAHIELAEVAARAAADAATVPLADLELQLPLHLRELCSTAHSPSLSLLPLRPEWDAELLQKFAAFFVARGRGGDGDVHALDFVHPGVINFREHQ